VSRYLQSLKRIPEESKASQWLTFLNNHPEVIARMVIYESAASVKPKSEGFSGARRAAVNVF
jgi:hypothetical protein